MMKIYLLIFLVGFILFLTKVPEANAFVLFQDPFSNPISSNWTFDPTRENNFIYTSFGIKDNNSSGYTFMYSPSSKFAHNNEVKMDVKFNSSVSYSAIMCRSSGVGGTYMGLLYNPTGGSAYNGFGIGLISTFSIDEIQGVHHFDLICNNDTFEVIEDGNIKYNNTSSLFNTSGDNSVLITFGGGGNNDEFANFQLCNPNDCSNPPPTPTPIQLAVPLVKQTGPSAPWQNATYDLATIWSPTNFTIGTWGCALTSADMILKYYGIDNLPGNGNLALTPGTLDAWLGVQPDGYIPNGNVNWLAIARLSKLAKKNNSTLLDALEYKRSNFMDTTNLLADLQQNHPDILEEQGHFVVATGKNTSNVYTINDPYYSYSDLFSYGNTFLSLGRFIPSFTDLSYMLFTSDPSLTVTLKDTGGNPVGESYTQQPLSADGTALSAGNPVNLLYLQQPGNGNYTLTISGSTDQLYTIKGYLYDMSGNVKPFSETGVVDSVNQNTVTLHFDGTNLTNDRNQKVTTVAGFLHDLDDLYQLKMVKTGAYNPLRNLGETVQKEMQKHNTILVKIDLGVMYTLLGIDKGVNFITTSAYQVLSQDIQYLQTHP